MEQYLQNLAHEIGTEYLPFQQYKYHKGRYMQQKIELCSGTLGIKTSETLKELITAGYKTFDLATAYSGGMNYLEKHCKVVLVMK